MITRTLMTGDYGYRDAEEVAKRGRGRHPIKGDPPREVIQQRTQLLTKWRTPINPENDNEK